MAKESVEIEELNASSNSDRSKLVNLLNRSHEKTFRSIRKRDGRIVEFNREKIIAAIFKAAKAVGGEDRQLADELGEIVVQYLSKQLGSGIPSVEEVQDAVEKAAAAGCRSGLGLLGHLTCSLAFGSSLFATA